MAELAILQVVSTILVREAVSQAEPSTYAAFWPLYLRDHARPVTRLLHACGSIGGLILLLSGIWIGSWWAVLGAPVFAYGMAWIGHFVIEHNRPATFRHPLWSLRGDVQMLALMATGRLDAEIARLDRVEDQQP